VTTIRSLSLRVFPNRTRCTYAVTWRTQRGESTTDRRLMWGDVPVPAEDLARVGLVQVLRLVVEDLERKGGVRILPEGAQEPRGAVGGGSDAGQGLAGIDEDD
jgi:hypothetical protein